MDKNKHKKWFSFPKGKNFAKLLAILAVLTASPGIIYYIVPAIGWAQFSMLVGSCLGIWAFIVYLVNIDMY